MSSSGFEELMGIVVPALQIFGILLIAWLFKKLVHHLIGRLAQYYRLRDEITLAVKRICNFVIFSITILFILDRLGVSGTILWTVFTGFAAVAAVAFFAAWSVLSNVCCAVLIVITRPFSLYDYIEILENGEMPGLKGQVIDINLIYTTLRERHTHGVDTVLQVPNNLFFQKAVRRWRNGSKPEINRHQVKPEGNGQGRVS